ncbi:ribosome biogenesis protein SLX9-domain-containing protein [Podospora appendiculata]|uniref:Ribosome biogenesis protein SLX9 n=1 Tax=Podospora appendiculata TaxID=314037 RepID=A0AAE1CHB4_9PEZI|nr:ribosome biogenesis protein SLX9-domain-containing protein [Podospora appendiculata]
MAPTAPTPGPKRITARQKAQARLADPLLPRKLHREDNVVSDSFINSKRDKRVIKHSSFVSRIAKASQKPSSALKRRRPSKKLVATLDSLGDALADIKDEMEAASGTMDDDQLAAAQGKVRHKSLRSRPGALKRKEKVVKGEMERFGRSLAQLTSVAEVPKADSGAAPNAASAGQAQVTAAQTDSKMDTGAEAAEQLPKGTTSNRWAALRGFISATMEQNPAFVNQTQKL